MKVEFKRKDDGEREPTVLIRDYGSTIEVSLVNDKGDFVANVLSISHEGVKLHFSAKAACEANGYEFPFAADAAGCIRSTGS